MIGCSSYSSSNTAYHWTTALLITQMVLMLIACNSVQLDGGTPRLNLTPVYSEPIRIENSNWAAQYPSIEWSGSTFVIAWEEVLFNSWGPGRLLFSSLDEANGSFPEIAELSYDVEFKGYTSMSRMGNDNIIAIQAYCPGSITCIKLLKSCFDGSILDTNYTNIYGKMALLCNTNGINIAWSDNYGIHYGKWSSDLTLAGSYLNLLYGTSISSGFSPSISWDGEHNIVSWQQVDNPPPYSRISIARINADGSIDATVTILEELGDSTNPRVAGSDNTAGLLYIDDNLNLVFRILDETNNTTDGPILIARPDVSQNQVLWTGAEFVLLWTEGQLYDRSLAYTTVYDGQRGDIEYLSAHNNAILDPAMVWTGSRVGVVWVEARDDSTQCFDRPNDRSGRIQCDLDVFFNFLDY